MHARGRVDSEAHHAEPAGTADGAGRGAVRDETFSGNRGLAIEEPLIFEIGRTDTTGVDLPEPAQVRRAPRQARRAPSRSACRASPSPRPCATTCACRQKNYGIDTGLFPLGSCTMKHNPRLNEQMARLPGFGDVHPLQPLSTVPGAIALIAELSRWLSELTGMPAIAMTPKAGAHGELCGLMAIKAAHRGARREALGRAGAGVGARHQSGDRGAARLSRRDGAGARGRHASIRRR